MASPLSLAPHAFRPGFRPSALPFTLTLVLGTALSAGAVYSYFAKRPRGTEPAKVFVGPLGGFTSLKLVNAQMVNDNTRKLQFEFPDKDAVSGLPVASAILSLTFPSNSSIPTLRPYTPISSPTDRGFLTLLVKHYPSGKASTALHNLQPGESIRFLGPLPGYTLIPNQHAHVALLAGGAGITPLYSLARGILSNPEDKTKITLVHGINTPEDAVLEKEWQELKQRYPERLQVVYTVSRGKNVLTGLTGFERRNGYVGRELLQEILPKQRTETMVFVCGPPAFEEALKGSRRKSGVLQELGYENKQVHSF